VILPSLRLLLWKEGFLKNFRDSIGNFVFLEDVWDKKVDHQWAWVMVEVYLREVLLEEVELVYDEWIFMKKMNY
jgi:hypothetical protein